MHESEENGKKEECEDKHRDQKNYKKKMGGRVRYTRGSEEKQEKQDEEQEDIHIDQMQKKRNMKESRRGRYTLMDYTKKKTKREGERQGGRRGRHARVTDQKKKKSGVGGSGGRDTCMVRTAVNMSVKQFTGIRRSSKTCFPSSMQLR